MQSAVNVAVFESKTIPYRLVPGLVRILGSHRIVVWPCDHDHEVPRTTVAVLLFLKSVLAGAADRTGPVFGKLIKRSSRRNTAIRITLCRIVNITTGDTSIFIHTSSAIAAISRHIASKIPFALIWQPASIARLVKPYDIRKEMRKAYFAPYC